MQKNWHRAHFMKVKNSGLVLWLQGGLGNQLFQLNAALTIAAERDVALSVSRASYIRDRYRRCEVRCLLEKGELLTLSEELYLGWPYKRDGSLRKRVWPSGLDVITDPWTDQGLLLGFFQEPQWLELPTSDVVARLERHRGERPAKHLVRLVAGGTAVHVRRGDYVTSDDARRTFGALNPSYYHSSLDKLQVKIEDAIFFSDDVEHVVNVFGVARGQVIGPRDTSDDFESLLLMSMASKLVIANSTFSWWAAELSGSRSKVCFPAPWFPGQPDRVSLGRSHWDPVENSGD